MLNTAETKARIYNGHAVRCGHCAPSASAWLRKEVAAGRVARLTGVEGWCPAHARWTFFVSSNHVADFLDRCKADHNALLGNAIMDEYVRGNHEAAQRLQDLLAA